MEPQLPLPELSALPEHVLRNKIKELNLKVAWLETKLEDTVDLLHVWKNHAFAYQKVLEVHGISTESLDQRVMADYLSETSG
ncbi:hypothetical protein N8787_02965 [Opitutaceae bacterium]|nr:hypothetical protein [Opitutaceae bacterium]